MKYWITGAILVLFALIGAWASNVSVDSSGNVTIDVGGTVYDLRNDWEKSWSGHSMEPTLPQHGTEFDAVAAAVIDTGTNAEIAVIAFDKLADECRGVNFIVPDDVDTSGSATFLFRWYSPDQTTLEVTWYITWNVTNDGETWNQVTTDDDGGADTVPGTIDQFSEFSFTETLSDLGWTGDEMVDLWVCRDGDEDKVVGGDDMDGDAHLRTFGIRIPRL